MFGVVLRWLIVVLSSWHIGSFEEPGNKPLLDCLTCCVAGVAARATRTRKISAEEPSTQARRILSALAKEPSSSPTETNPPETSCRPACCFFFLCAFVVGLWHCLKIRDSLWLDETAVIGSWLLPGVYWLLPAHCRLGCCMPQHMQQQWQQ